MPKQRSCAKLIHPITHTQIVEHYKNCQRQSLEAERVWFSEEQSFLDVIRRVALAKGPNNKRLTHQYRLDKPVIPLASQLLQSASEKLHSVQTFKDLFDEVEKCISNIKGVGPLYIYDTALRLGFFKKLQPNEVYLQAGSLKAAKHLAATGQIQKLTSRIVLPSQFPITFRSLPAYEIENLLCQYFECL